MLVDRMRRPGGAQDFDKLDSQTGEYSRALSGRPEIAVHDLSGGGVLTHLPPATFSRSSGAHSRSHAQRL